MAANRDDAPAKWLGLAVFLLGVVFMVLVFTLAYRDITGAGVLGQLASPTTTVNAEGAIRALVIKGVLFFVLGYVGSAVAGRGIGLYAASRGGNGG